LGVKGGLDESNLSAYLVGAAGSSDYVCVDAGTINSGLEKAIGNGVLTGTASSLLKTNIKAYLISHPHLDHVSGLIINSPEDTAKNIYALPFTIKTLQEKYFSWQSWANFGDAGETPQLKKYHYVALPEGHDTLLQNTSLSVTAIPLSHSNPGESTAFLIRNGSHYLLYLGDTGPDAVEHSERLLHLWQTVAPLVKSRQLKAIFIEASFFNEKPDNQLFGHLTPRLLMMEMSVLNKLAGNGALNGFPVVLTHSKYFGKDELKLRTQIEKENKFKLKLIFPEQGSLYEF
jgi:cAMP phosphodiesterase